MTSLHVPSPLNAVPLPKPTRVPKAVGRVVLSAIERLGEIVLFLAAAARQVLKLRFYGQTVRQCAFVGVDSIPIVLITAFFTGGVLALQGYTALGGTGLASTQLPRLVVISMVRELGPVLAALMVTSRAGAAMSAELASMRVTEQIDALTTLATNPMRYLVVPRIIACIAMLPLLVILANLMGIFGGYAVATLSLNMSSGLYLSNSFGAINSESLMMTLCKAATFGLLIGLMATFHGYTARGGAAGVGQATTRAVVYAAVAILVIDYFITAVFV